MSGVDRGKSAPFSWIGDPLAWNDAKKCLFAALIYFGLSVCYWVLIVLNLRYTAVAPYFDSAVGERVLTLQTILLVAWLVIVAICIAHRQRVHSPRLVAATITLCVYELLYGSYISGFFTDIWSGLAFIGSWAVGLALFSRRAMQRAMFAVSIGVVGTTIAEQLGLIPYAPIFQDAPFHGGILSRSWVFGPGALSMVMLAAIALVLYFIIERWHDREAALAVTSDQLTRANDVISRYVASQLADQVRAGNFGVLDHHERRRLTLFFSDIEDFAATADSMEPEDLSALLNEYLSEMTSVAERHGATIDKFVGDAIMIFFGAPGATSDPDHALRAVRMALEMQARLAHLQESWRARGIEKPFRVRIGINTGHASIGTFGSRARLEYTAIGRQVNLAARLQAQCDPGRILLSHATWVFVRDQIPCTPKGDIMLKGFREPVKAYEVCDEDVPTLR